MKHDQLLARFRPCASAVEWYATQVSSEEAWHSCRCGAWMLWLLCRLGFTQTDLRKVTAFVTHKAVVDSGIGDQFVCESLASISAATATPGPAAALLCSQLLDAMYTTNPGLRTGTAGALFVVYLALGSLYSALVTQAGNFGVAVVAGNALDAMDHLLETRGISSRTPDYIRGIVSWQEVSDAIAVAERCYAPTEVVHILADEGADQCKSS